MRWPWVFSLLLGATSAAARPAPPFVEDPDRGDFWREITDPHGDEVRALLGKARELVARPEAGFANDSDWSVDTRARFYRDAYNVLRAAQRLSPDNADVLGLLGRVADELGLTREATDALNRSARISGADKVPPEVAAQLGMIALRRGDPDAGIRWLRLAQSPRHPIHAIHLAHALAAGGQPTAAIDALASTLSWIGSLNQASDSMLLVKLSLALHYDRDEQHDKAFARLDEIQQSLQQRYPLVLQTELARLALADPSEAHYYRGLLYESLGFYTEARAEWAHYAAITGTPWRARALEHIAAIDRERQLTPGPRPPIEYTPQAVVPRWRAPRP